MESGEDRGEVGVDVGRGVKGGWRDLRWRVGEELREGGGIYVRWMVGEELREGG